MENLNHQLWQMRCSAKNNCGISGFAKNPVLSNKLETNVAWWPLPELEDR